MREDDFLVCQSVFGQKPETIMPLQCSCGSQLPMLLYLLNLAVRKHYFCDHGRYSYFLVFKNHELLST